MARTISVSGDTAVEATQGAFPLLDDGDYIATIIGAEDQVVKSEANKGLPTLDVQFKISEGDFAGKKYKAFGVPVFEKWKSGKVAFQFFTFWGAVGVKFPKKGESFDVEIPDNEDLLGEEIGVRVTTKPDRNGKPRNNFDFFPASQGVSEAPKPAAVDDDEFVL